jgi:hypothetical protein
MVPLSQSKLSKSLAQASASLGRDRTSRLPRMMAPAAAAP